MLIAAVVVSGVFAVDGEIPTQCPEKDPEDTTIRLKHESDCSKYYECLQGKKIARVCPYRNRYNDRLHFNPALQTCAWPDFAVCEDSSWSRPRMCPRKLKYCVRVPHPKDCNKFYLCDQDHEEEHKCADGLHFNPDTQMCDYQKSAGCEISCVWTCCPPKGSDVEVRLPHECTCTKYYECKDGEQVVRQCPEDRHFDNRLKRCRRVDDAGCIVQPLGDTVKCPEDDGGKVVKLPHESDCGKYYQCVHGDMTLRKCHGSHSFNPSLGVCDFPHNIPCNVSRCCSPKPTMVQPATPRPSDEDYVLPTIQDPDCPVEGTVKLPHPTNCTLYYVCENGWKTIRSCPRDLYFNPIINECDWPYGPIICDPYPTDLASLRLGLPASESDSVCYGKCPLPDPENKTVYLPADDCAKFCKCSNGVPQPMKCPKGLRFDRKRQVCNWPWAVVCEDAINQTGSS